MQTPPLSSIEISLTIAGLLLVVFFMSPWGQRMVTRTAVREQWKEEQRQNNIRLFGVPDVD